MIGPKEKGGLNMPDFDIINNSLKVTWIKRLNDSPKKVGEELTDVASTLHNLGNLRSAMGNHQQFWTRTH